MTEALTIYKKTKQLEYCVGVVKTSNLYQIKQHQIYFMNSGNRQSERAPNDELVKDSSRKRFVKFPLNSFPKKDTTDVPNHFDERSQISSQNGPLLKGQNNSEKSLSSVKTPRRIPYTPLKQRKSHSKKTKVSHGQTLHEVVLKIKILLKDIERLLENIKKKFSQTAQYTIKYIEGAINNYLHQIMIASQSQRSTHMNQLIIEDYLVTPEYKPNSQVVAPIPTQKGKTIQKHCQVLTNNPSQKIFDSVSQPRHERETQGKSNIFSNTIQIREKLRKDATDSVLVVRQQKIQGERGLVRAMEREKGQQSEQKRQMTRSIEKLQRQLRSLKNILNE